MLLQKKRLNRQPANTMDKCTIVSIYPRAIKERKLTMAPSVYRIPSGTYDKPALLEVGTASWWREMDPDDPNLLEIPNGSILVAEAVITDYCKGLFGYVPGAAMPGLFWVQGSHTVASIKKDHTNLLDKAKAMQENYYHRLINEADGYWARTSGNPLGITDDMRLAAKELGIQGKDWMSNFQQMQNIRCVACGSPRNPNFPVCPTCKAVVDQDLAKKLGLTFAQ